MKAKNSANIVEDFAQPYLTNANCELHRSDLGIHIGNGLWYIIIYFILLNLSNILLAFS